VHAGGAAGGIIDLC